MNRNRRRLVAGAAVIPAMVLSLGAVQSGVAEAAPPPLVCGQMITANTTMKNDVGPCTGDGLVIQASNVRLNMNGHRVFGALGVGIQGAAGQNAGIHIKNPGTLPTPATSAGVSGVTVLNGEVNGFAVGVRIDGGGNNKVRSLYVHDNVGPTGSGDNGDGIAAWNSSNNTFDSNLVVHNGPYSGMALVTGGYNTITDPAITASGNVMKNNLVFNNNVSVCTAAAGCQPRDPNTGVGITMPAPVTNPPTVPTPPPVPFRVPRGALTTGGVDAGIRIEGPNEVNTVVDHNVVKDSGIDGIFVQASCHNAFMPQPAPPAPPITPCIGDVGDTGSIIKNNQSDHNGYGGGGSGIDLWAMLGLPGVIPATYSTVTSNSTKYNFADGIQLYSTCGPGDNPARCATNHNDIVSNTATDNRLSGIMVEGGSANNAVVQNDVSNNRNTSVNSGTPPVPNPTAGLFVEEGATDNLLFMNHGTGNSNANVPATAWDGADTNPACDSNRWQANRFGTVNQPCVRTSTWPTSPGAGAARANAAARASNAKLRNAA